MRFLIALALLIPMTALAETTTPPTTSTTTTAAADPLATHPYFSVDCATVTDATQKTACEAFKKYQTIDCATLADPDKTTCTTAKALPAPAKKGLTRSTNNRLEAESTDE